MNTRYEEGAIYYGKAYATGTVNIAGYADKLEGEDRIILNVKPGITGPAQIKYRNEAILLQQAENPLEFNNQVLWPDKVEINKHYVQHWSFMGDLKILWNTVF